MFLVLGLCSCQQTAQIQDLQKQVQEAESKIAALEEEDVKWLVHLVYFKMQEGSGEAEKKALIANLFFHYVSSVVYSVLVNLVLLIFFCEALSSRSSQASNITI